MNKRYIVLSTVIIICLSMTYLVAERAENMITKLLLVPREGDVSVELLTYQRRFFSAIASMEIKIKRQGNTPLVVVVESEITHFPYQVLIKNRFKIVDPVLAKKVASYFSTPDWMISEERINLFSQLSGQLRLPAGSYQSATDSLNSQPLQLDYSINLNNEKGNMTVSWAGLTANVDNIKMNLNALQFSSHFGQLQKINDYNYQLSIASLTLEQQGSRSSLQDISLSGSSQFGQKSETIDTRNELFIGRYQMDSKNEKAFTNNHLQVELSGLYQPAFELLNAGSQSALEIEDALVELVNHGAHLNLSTLTSQTPWGEVDASLNLTLRQGAWLVDILENPYILFDHMQGDAHLLLPSRLLEESTVSEVLQMGLRSGLLKQNEEVLTLQSSYQQGELTLNGRVIPL